MYGRHHELVDRYENIHSLNGIIYFPFYGDISFPLTPTRVLPSNTSYEKQELLIRREHVYSTPVFGGARVAHIFSFRFLYYV